MSSPPFSSPSLDNNIMIANSTKAATGFVVGTTGSHQPPYIMAADDDEHQEYGSTYEHDDFEEENCCTSSDDDLSTELDNDSSRKDKFIDGGDECVASLERADDRWSNVERELSLGVVPREVTMAEGQEVGLDTQHSFLSDVTGVTDFDKVADMSGSGRFSSGVRGGKSSSGKNRVVAMSVKTYYEDGSFTERLENSNGTSTIMTGSSSSSDKKEEASKGASVTSKSNPPMANNGSDKVRNRQASRSVRASSLPKNCEAYEEQGRRPLQSSSHSADISWVPETPAVVKESRLIDAVCVPMNETDDCRPSTNSEGYNKAAPDDNWVERSKAAPKSNDTSSPTKTIVSNIAASESRGFSKQQELKAAARTVCVSAVDESSTTEVLSKTGSSKSQKPKVTTRTTIKKIAREPNQGTRDNHAARGSAKATKGGAVRKSTTYCADGSCIEKTVHADGTTTTVRHSTQTRNGASTTSESMSGNRSTTSSASYSGSATSERKGQPRPRATGRHNPKTVGSSGATKPGDAKKRIVKSRKTITSADGSRTEIIEYTDGSKTTRTTAAPRRKRANDR